jgi:hypothetical protein
MVDCIYNRKLNDIDVLHFRDNDERRFFLDFQKHIKYETRKNDNP